MISVFQYIDELAGPVILCQVLLAAVQICFTGWAIMQLNAGLVNTIKFVVFLVISSLQMMFWCWSGESIIRESSNVGHVIFREVPWSILSCSVRRDLSFIIRRLQNQSELTAVRVQVVCLKKFTENLIRNLKAPVLDLDADIDEILRPNRYLLTCVGLWPLAPNASLSVRVISLSCFVVTVVLCTAMIVPQFTTICIYWGDLNVLSDVGSLMLAYMMLLFKILYVVLRRNDYRVAYEFTCEFWRTARNQEERDYVVRLTNDARFCTIFFVYSGTVDYLLFTGASMLITRYNYGKSNGSNYYHKLPVDLWYGLDTQVSPNYELFFVLQTLALAFGMAGAIGVDCTMMSIIMQIAAQFRLVSLRLKAIGQRISDGFELENKPGNKLRMAVRDCVTHHDAILSVFQYVDELVGPIIFCQMLLSAVQICFGGWTVMQPSNDVVNTIKFVIFLVIMWMQMLFWCWSGEAIIRESSNIGHVIFREVPWSILPCSVRRDLTFIIRRSQKQSELTAMGLQVMRLKRLAEVFNTAISYLALLRSMKDK